MENSSLYDSMSESNRRKNKSGSDFDRLIHDELESLKKKGAIIGYMTNEKLSHPNYSYASQYLANYIITTNEGKYIAVRSTKSFRLDRIKICYYDLDGINRFAGFSDNLVASIVLVDDSELGTTSFVNTREKFKSGNYYCPATHLLALSEFIEFLQEFSYAALQSDEDENAPGIFEDLFIAEPTGSKYGKAGNKLEKVLGKLLSDYNVLKQYKIDTSKCEPIYTMVVDKLCDDHQLNKEDIIRIKATNSVPMLNSGGNAKTDVIVYLETSDGETQVETISIKNTKSKRVSCHDYTVVDYIRVLNAEDTRLSEYLEWFCAAGSRTGMMELMEDGYSEKEFEEELGKQKKTLIEWALTGAHDSKNLIDEDLQVSRYLLIRNESNLAFFSMVEYVDKVSHIKGMFGLPFSWTYPSSQKGVRIQLKVPILIE